MASSVPIKTARPGCDDLEVNVTTNIGVETGNGYATIKPDDTDALLTTLTFTPENPDEFGDFSFRGQPNEDVTEANPITVTVTDNQGNPSADLHLLWAIREREF